MSFLKTVETFEPEPLTRREYFAAMAMQGVVVGFTHRDITWEEYQPAMAANRAVKYADALIAELNKISENV